MIPENSLEFEDGTPCRTPVDVRVWEFYDFADILLAGLSTESDEGLLETGGMVYLEAESQGRKLRLRKGSNAKITFSPKREIDSGFELYHGGMRNGRVRWEKARPPAPPPNSSTLVVSLNSKASFRRDNRYFEDHPAKLGFLQFLSKDDAPRNSTIITDFTKPQSFDGWGEAAFSNGVTLFFIGKLELAKFQTKGAAGYDRFRDGVSEEHPSELEIRFSGSFLSGKIPSLHKNSRLRIFIQNRGFPVPYITTSPDKTTGLFTLYEGALAAERNTQADSPDIRCLQGKTSIYTAGKYIHLDADGELFADKFSRGETRVQLDTNHDRKGSRDVLLARYHAQLLNGMRRLGSHQVAVDGASPRLVGLKERLQKLQARGARPDSILREVQRSAGQVMTRLESLRNFDDAAKQFRDFALEEGLDEAHAKYSDLTNNLGVQIAESMEFLDFDLDDEFIQEILVEARKLNSFTSEFLSPQLGWHNLDKLRHARGPDAPYDLVSEYLEPASISSTQANSPSMGPYYYSIWPAFSISKGAVPGENSIPGGDFTAFGFAVDGKGQIHADMKRAKTNQQVVLNLKQMDRETFRKKVKGFQ